VRNKQNIQLLALIKGTLSIELATSHLTASSTFLMTFFYLSQTCPQTKNEMKRKRWKRWG
jgi:hypothetical protein